MLSGVTPTTGLGVYNNTVHTVERALLERYFMVKISGEFRRPIAPAIGMYDTPHFLRFADTLISSMRRVATVYSDVATAALYTGPKRRLYEAALRSLAQVCVNKGDAKIRQFAKLQKQDLSSAPRIINPRSSRYNLEAARYLKKLEKQAYRAINKAWGGHTDHTVIKGLNCFESAKVIRQKWDRFNQPVAVMMDATKWDAHVSLEALQYEHSVYNGVFECEHLAKLLFWQLINRGKAWCDDGTVEFIMQATRASGDINTSMGNCILMCAIIWAFCEQIEVDAELGNNGDDCFVIIEQDQLKKFMASIERWFADCGFSVVIEPPVTVFEHIDFCQTRPMYDGSQWRMIRNPLACMKKDGICLLPMVSSRTYARWLTAVGECGLAAASGVPVLQEWYAMFKRNGKPCSNKFKRYIHAHTIYDTKFADVKTKPGQQITIDARVSFYNGTGVTPAMQIEYETLFKRMKLNTEFGDGGEEYVDKACPIINLAPNIFDNTYNIHNDQIWQKGSQ